MREAAKIIKYTFVMWALMAAVTGLGMQLILPGIAPQFLVAHITAINVVSTILWAGNFIIFFISFRKLKDYDSGRFIISVWAFLLLVVWIQDLYIKFSFASNMQESDAVITGIPIEVLCAVIGSFVSCLLLKKRYLKILCAVNLVILAGAVIGTVLPDGNVFYIIIKQLLHYSAVLILNLLVIGKCYKMQE